MACNAKGIETRVKGNGDRDYCLSGLSSLSSLFGPSRSV